MAVFLRQAANWVSGITARLSGTKGIIAARSATRQAAARRSSQSPSVVNIVVLYLGVHLTETYPGAVGTARGSAFLPSLTPSTQIILGVLAGFIGVLLATLLVANISVIFQMAYVEDVLGDRHSADPARRSNSRCCRSYFFYSGNTVT
jgi:hypothetical protein